MPNVEGTVRCEHDVHALFLNDAIKVMFLVQFLTSLLLLMASTEWTLQTLPTGGTNIDGNLERNLKVYRKYNLSSPCLVVEIDYNKQISFTSKFQKRSADRSLTK